MFVKQQSTRAFVEEKGQLRLFSAFKSLKVSAQPKEVKEVSASLGPQEYLILMSVGKTTTGLTFRRLSR